MILLQSADTLRTLCEHGKLGISQKEQPQGYNYYFTPPLRLTLYSPKVVVSTSSYIVLQYDKYEKEKLFNMLRSISSQLKAHLKRCFPIRSEINVYDMFMEQSMTFTIRCSLPHVGKKYFIETTTPPFRVPRSNEHLHCVGIDIRNMWESNNRIGFNLELKHIEE